MTTQQTDLSNPQSTGAEPVKAEERKNKALDKLFERATKQENFAVRRKPSGTRSQVVMVSNAKHRKKPQRYQQTVEYDFLQYIRIVKKWALENHNITTKELDMLLYLNPAGIFTQKDFYFFHKTIGMYGNKAFERLMAEGWISVWRERKNQQKALYTLTTKAKLLCNRMHKMCLGEEDIPVSRANKMLTSDKVINKYYLEVIKKMKKSDNKKVPEE